MEAWQDKNRARCSSLAQGCSPSQGTQDDIARGGAQSFLVLTQRYLEEEAAAP